MNVILYTIDCPKCQVLERKLAQKNIPFTICKDKDLMMQKGFTSAPILEVDGLCMVFEEAFRWANSFNN